MNPRYAVARVTRRGFVVSAAVGMAGCAGGGGDGSGSEEAGSAATATDTPTPPTTDVSDGDDAGNDPTQTPNEGTTSLDDLPAAEGEYPFLLSGQEAEDYFNKHLSVERRDQRAHVRIRNQENLLVTDMENFDRGQTDVYPQDAALAGLFEDGTIPGVIGEEFLTDPDPTYSVGITTKSGGVRDSRTWEYDLPEAGSEFLHEADAGYAIVIDGSAFFEVEDLYIGSVGVHNGSEDSNGGMVLYQPAQ